MWEYRSLLLGLGTGLVPSSSMDRTLSELGAEGWELVAVVGPLRGPGSIDDQAVAFFKRRRIDPQAAAAARVPSAGAIGDDSVW